MAERRSGSFSSDHPSYEEQRRRSSSGTPTGYQYRASSAGASVEYQSRRTLDTAQPLARRQRRSPLASEPETVSYDTPAPGDDDQQSLWGDQSSYAGSPGGNLERLNISRDAFDNSRSGGGHDNIRKGKERDLSYTRLPTSTASMSSSSYAYGPERPPFSPSLSQRKYSSTSGASSDSTSNATTPRPGSEDPRPGKETPDRRPSDGGGGGSGSGSGSSRRLVPGVFLRY